MLNCAGFSPSTSVLPSYSLFPPVLHIHISFIFHRNYTVCNRRNWQLRSTNNSLLLQHLTTYVSSTSCIWFTCNAGLLTITFVTHFKRISCRLFISGRVIGNRTDDRHFQKAADNILNMQLGTTPSGWSFLLWVRRCRKYSYFKRNTL